MQTDTGVPFKLQEPFDTYNFERTFQKHSLFKLLIALAFIRISTLNLSNA